MTQQEQEPQVSQLEELLGTTSVQPEAMSQERMAALGYGLGALLFAAIVPADLAVYEHLGVNNGPIEIGLKIGVGVVATISCAALSRINYKKAAKLSR